MNQDHNEVIDSAIKSAVQLAYLRSRAHVNECEFKYEVFHILCSYQLDGNLLGTRVQGSDTCYLHGEARPEWGKSSKADLLICDPFCKAGFNYEVQAVIEFKHLLTKATLEDELVKCSSYKKPLKLYIVSALKTKLSLESRLTITSKFQKIDVTIISPENEVSNGLSYPAISAVETIASMDQVVPQCIDAALNLYGQGRRQFHGFYWCNYEHETAKGWTFPSEGDFNCQLYHFLRMSLPNSVEIYAEHKVRSGRADYYLYDKIDGSSECIEVKMNWDQFKPKFKKGVLAPSDVDIINAKFVHLSTGSPRHKNRLVVIQGEDGHKSVHKETARKTFALFKSPLLLHYYSESQNRPIGPVSI